MIKSVAERSREFRQRQKAAARQASKAVSAMPAYLKRPFSESFNHDRIFELDENLDAFGIQIAGTDFLTVEPQVFPTQADHGGRVTSLQRAMGLVGTFLDAAQELSKLINAYKLEEVARAIDDAMQESANLPRGDVAAMEASITAIEALRRIRADLETPTRVTLPSVRAREE